MLPYATTTDAPKLTAAAMSAARSLTFQPYSSTTSPAFTQLAEVWGWDQQTAGKTLFKITLTAGGLYNMLTASFLDPKELTIYDQFGNVMALNTEENDPSSIVFNGAAYQVDAGYEFAAPYTGTYYVEAGWQQGRDSTTSFYILDVLANLNFTKTLHAPEVGAVPTYVEWKEGSAISYTLKANAFTDVDANTTLTYYATLKDGGELPSWMKLDSATGAFSGVALANTPDLDILVFAKDQTGLVSAGAPMKFATLGAPVDTSPLTLLTTAYTNILRYAPATDNQAFKDMVADVVSGKLSMNSALSVLLYAADQTTTVASLSYQFFTGKIPSQGGYDYLIAPTGPNPNNLNSAYYQNFNMENRYINFAVNLGKVGEGKDAFALGYGSLSLFEATREAYETIFGRSPTDAKVHALIDSRIDYFAAYGGDGPEGIGTKAAMAGWLLAEAVKADVGMYALSNDAFLFDLADGANFGVSLVGVYGKAQYAYG